MALPSRYAKSSKATTISSGQRLTEAKTIAVFFQQHALILASLLTDPTLRLEAEGLAQLLPVTLNFVTAKQYVERVDQFTRKLKTRLKQSDEMIGFIYPSLLEHMLEEGELALTLLNGNDVPSSRAAAQHLINHNIDVLMLVVHLLDPRESEWIRHLTESAATFHNIQKQFGSSVVERQPPRNPKQNIIRQWLTVILRQCADFDKSVAALEQAAISDKVLSVLTMPQLAHLLGHERRENKFWQQFILIDR